MTISVDKLTEPAVRAFVGALNSGDRDSFRTTLAPGATMSDDGNDRDIDEWTAREVFDSRGHMEVESQSADGLSLVARYRNDTWGEMRTSWKFSVEGGRVARFETGQA